MSAEILDDELNFLISTEFSVRTTRDVFKHCYGICNVNETVKYTGIHVAVYGNCVGNTGKLFKHGQCLTYT
jgi:hypothetical protein